MHLILIDCWSKTLSAMSVYIYSCIPHVLFNFALWGIQYLSGSAVCLEESTLKMYNCLGHNNSCTCTKCKRQEDNDYILCAWCKSFFLLFFFFLAGFSEGSEYCSIMDAAVVDSCRLRISISWWKELVTSCVDQKALQSFYVDCDQVIIMIHNIVIIFWNNASH